MLGIPVAFVLSAAYFGKACNYFLPCWFAAYVGASGARLHSDALGVASLSLKSAFSPTAVFHGNVCTAACRDGRMGIIEALSTEPYR